MLYQLTYSYATNLASTPMLSLQSVSVFAAGIVISYVIFSLLNRKVKLPFINEKLFEDDIEQFKILVDNLPDGVFIKDLKGKYIVCNNVFKNLIPKDLPANIIGKTDFDLFDDKIATRYFSEDQLIIQGKKSKISSEEVLELEGNSLYITSLKTPITGKKGNIIGIMGIISDVTNQKQSSIELLQKNELLTKEKQLLRTLIDNMPDVIYIKDKETNFLDVNPALVDITKAKSREELLGKNDYDFFPKDIADIFSKDDKHVLKSGESIINKEEIGFDNEGNIRIRSTTKVPYYDEEGKIAGLVGIGRDITQQKENEEKLKEQAQSLQEINILLEERQEEINQQSEELSQQNDVLENERNLLRTLINNIPDWVYIKDKHSAFIAANKPLLENVGLELESEILGKTDFDFFPADLAKQYSVDEQQVLTSGKALQAVEEPTVDKNGDTIFLLTTKVPYCSPDGEILGIVGIGRNITAQKDAEKKLREQADHLKEVNVLLEERQEEIQLQSSELSSQNTILENERNLLRTLIDNIPDVIYIKDTESRFVTANAATIDLVKAGSLEHILGKTDFDFFNNEQANQHFEDEKRIFATKEAIVDKSEKICLDDRLLVLSTTKVPYFDSDNRLLGIVGIGRDITALVEANDKLEDQAENLSEANALLEERQEEIQQQTEFLSEQNLELAREKNLLRVLIDSMPDYIYVKDIESRFLLANKALVKVTHQKSMDELLGKTDFDLNTYSHIAERYFTDEQNIIKSGKAIVNKEEIGYDEEGRERVISTTKVPFNDADGKISGIVGIGRDITKQKNSEKQLREQAKNLQEVNALLVDRQDKIQHQTQILNSQADSLKKANVQLEKLNATKNKFFSIIAHDLKNPFQAIFGFSELLLRNYNDYDEKQQFELISMIKSSSESAYNLLENLLQWARSQTDRIKYNPQIFELKQLVEQNLELTKASSEKKHITVESHLECDTHVYADKNMVNLVLRNLLSNAIKFTDFDGMIMIRCFKFSDDFLAVAVTDTGIGMTEDNLDKLFKIDEYFSTSGTAGEGGTGLGLIICKEFIEKNQGELNVESELGIGTTFTFTLPVKELK